MLKLLATLLFLVGATWLLGEFLPNRIAQQDEQRRDRAFRQIQVQIRERNLPVCPARGPALDQFLNARERDQSNGVEMWRPLCYFERFRDGAVTVVVSNRSELRTCTDNKERVADPVTCVVDEPVRFLSHPEAGRTWARQETTDERGRSVLWMSGRPLAWSDHLVAESRGVISVLLCGLVGVCLIALAIARTVTALRLRRLCHAPGEPRLPITAEFLLHWLVGSTSNSLPGDLSEEYQEQLDSGVESSRADAWYNVQVRLSIFPLVARRLEELLQKAFGIELSQRKL